ncbi:Sel1 repeat family protein [Candida parapsilosis]|uniref:Protein DSF2 n=2 Tax=Candida parapsilosis TaxID=5480 RepID=G8BGK1_CANPC|nr:uncharacterized protein CPAR2_206290 [Candida parapsilosis]KAF6054865.1 Sel1 repeat family protein [Candida parapsilosis]KAF6056111.1 Sel1 repeat family protein [Candida parapsilosis]KAF6059043.1 Sel1 repeat family protein [Candida parapsilosis]KAF6067800.1 Sel1 repeat family protein [Candida parapsilosis]KAI5903587.1 hypothetical protein K4G60_g2742 [Candida parapsilosis]
MNEQFSLSKSDRDSVYSFDSVSTNERLLDRLDFDAESIISNDSYRSSIISSRGVHGEVNANHGARTPVLGSWGSQPFQTKSTSQTNGIFLPQKPMNNLNAIRRMKDYTSSTDITQGKIRNRLSNGQPNDIASRNNAEVGRGNSTSGKSGIMDNQAASRGTSKAGFRTRDDTNTLSKNEPIVNTDYAPNRVANFTQLRTQSPSSSISKSNNTLSRSKSELDASRNTTAVDHRSMPANSSATSINSRSIASSQKPSSSHASTTYNDSIDTATPDISHLSLSSTQGRNFSPSSTLSIDRKEHSSPHDDLLNKHMDNAIPSNYNSLDNIHSHGFVSSEGVAGSSHVHALKSQELSPESRTVISQELRAQGKHREASYQLQIAANEPFNNTKAMYLYALALKHGQGVKQNYNTSLKWLCKCILLTQESENSSQHKMGHLSFNSGLIASKLNNISQKDLLQLVLVSLKKSQDSSGMDNGENAEMLYTQFKSYNKSEINKIIARNKSRSDIVALSYYELGMYLLNGIGGSSNPKTDEANGIICLSKSAAMCSIEAMEQLGELWTTKTKFRKKDLNKAAAWLRSAEVFGAKSIGNSWIYKEKYMRANTN